MYIRWWGHACFEIGNDITILTDPHDGKTIGLKAPISSPDIVLMSHDHFDHNATRILNGDFEVVKEDGKIKSRGMNFNGFLTYHDKEFGDKRGSNIIYKWEIDGISFLHLGDLGHLIDKKFAEKIGKVDVLFIPVGDVFTISPEEARKVVKIIKPKVVVPMHYRVGGLSLSIRPVSDFLEGYKESQIHKIGNSIEFEKSDFPDEMDIWVFSI